MCKRKKQVIKDYYSILDVKPDSSLKEIKSAFRKKAKEKHPDVIGENETIRLYLEAYRILSDSRLRREYDRTRLHIIPKAADESFDYRKWLKERLSDPEYVAKLIFYDLLHSLEDEALELYDSIKNIDNGRLERFFERSEAMDAEFCIAEEYIKRGRFEDAYFAITKLIKMEQKKPCFGYFYDVVLFTYKHLVIDSLPKVIEPEPYCELLDEAIMLKSSKENDAQFCRKKAEILQRQGKTREARHYLLKAFSLCPKLPGLKAMLSR